jgi:hypothetical protein
LYVDVSTCRQNLELHLLDFLWICYTANCRTCRKLWIFCRLVVQLVVGPTALTPLARFAVDCGFIVDLLWICCGFAVQLVVQQIHNISNKWSLSLRSRFLTTHRHGTEMVGMSPKLFQLVESDSFCHQNQVVDTQKATVNV